MTVLARQTTGCFAKRHWNLMEPALRPLPNRRAAATAIRLVPLRISMSSWSAGRIRIALEAFQIATQFGGGLVAQIAVFFEGLPDNLFQFRRKIGIQGAGRNGRAVEDRIEYYGGSIAGERSLPRSHFIKDGAEAEKIGAGVEFFAAGLLW